MYQSTTNKLKDLLIYWGGQKLCGNNATTLLHNSFFGFALVYSTRFFTSNHGLRRHKLTHSALTEMTDSN